MDPLKFYRERLVELERGLTELAGNATGALTEPWAQRAAEVKQRVSEAITATIVPTQEKAPF